MARLPRFVIPGQPQHVIQRGNDRQAIFRNEQDYRFYLEKLREAAEKHQCDIHAYVLMTNHVHLLITPHTETGIGKTMQSIGRYYVQYFNHCYKRTGTLWEGRYKAALIDSEVYLLTCMRYIELNPVRVDNMANQTLAEIREATNKAWTLGSEKFQQRIEKQIDRQVRSIGHGGDRKSELYLKSRSLTP